MPRKKPSAQPASAARGQSPGSQSGPAAQPPVVPVRWLATALGIVALAAVACAWGTLCLVFWQGSWQLLYHPAAAVTRTPADAGMPFQPVRFAPGNDGEPQLHGWWIPRGAGARYTAIYLHGANGNLGNTVDALMPLYGAGLNVFAFDYRGYGASQPAHPSQARWRQGAESAIAYLTGTRHIPANALILVGQGLGANLALEMAAIHPELAGVVLDQPLQNPMDPVFSDPRAKLVPAHALVSDRFDLNGPAAELRIPLLWIQNTPAHGQSRQDQPAPYRSATARKTLVWLASSPDPVKVFYTALTRWLDDLAQMR